MCKSAEKAIQLERIGTTSKQGEKSGDWLKLPSYNAPEIFNDRAKQVTTIGFTVGFLVYK
jgi:hypothetical protein